MPNYKTGWTLGWCGNREKFYPHKVRTFSWEDKTKPDIYLDYEHQGYTLKEVKDEKWFSPIGKEKDYIPSFPSKEKIKDNIFTIVFDKL